MHTGEDSALRFQLSCLLPHSTFLTIAITITTLVAAAPCWSMIFPLHAWARAQDALFTLLEFALYLSGPV